MVTDENRRGVKGERERERKREKERERERRSRLCVREEFNPQKHPNGSCSVQMGKEGS